MAEEETDIPQNMNSKTMGLLKNKIIFSVVVNGVCVIYNFDLIFGCGNQ